MGLVERVVYDKDDKYLVGRLIKRDVTASGPVLYFRDACLIPKEDVPTDRRLEVALADIYVATPRENKHFPEFAFANKKPIATLRIDLE